MAGEINAVRVTRPTAAAAAIPGKRVVFEDTSSRGNVKLPGNTVPLTAAGVTLETQLSGASVVELSLGPYTLIESDGSAVINPGDNVIGVANTGRIKAQALGNTANTAIQVLGQCRNHGQVAATAGSVVVVEWRPQIIFATT